MVAVGGSAAQIDAVGAGDLLAPFAGTVDRRRHQAEVDVLVVGDDPQPAVGGVAMIFDVRPAAGDQHRLGARVAGGNEPHFAGCVVAGGDEDQAAVLRSVDSDREALVLMLLVEDRALAGSSPRRCSFALSLRQCSLTSVKTIALLSLVQTGWPMATSLTVSMSCAGGEVADAQLEPLRPVVVDQRRQQFAVRRHGDRAQAEIIQPGRGRDLVEDQFFGAAIKLAPKPLPVLRARLERPPIFERPVGQRDAGQILLDAALHLLEQGIDQRLVRLRRKPPRNRRSRHSDSRAPSTSVTFG